MNNRLQKTTYPLQFIFVFILILLSSKLIVFTGIQELIKLFFVLFAFNYLGFMICSKSKSINEMPSIIQTALCIFIGGFVYSLLVVCFFKFGFRDKSFIFYLSFIPLIFGLFFRNKFSIAKIELLCILPFILLVFDKNQYALASSPDFINIKGDYFYYTAITKSLSVNFNIFDAEFHKGIPISYQSLPFFFPAIISFLTGVKAHTALWAIAMPLYSIFSFGTIAAFIQRFVLSYFPDLLDKKTLITIFISASLILLAPLNVQYLVKWDISNFIFLGEGYLLPTGSPCFALSIWFFGILCFMLYSPNYKFNKWDIFFASVFLGLIAVTKLALFIPVFILTGLVFLPFNFKQKRIVFSEGFSVVLIGGIISIFLYKTFFVASTTFIVKLASDGGFFTQFIKETIVSKGLPQNALYIFALSCFLVLSWLGLKLFFFYKLDIKPNYLKQIILCSFVTLLISAFPAFLLDSFIVDETSGRVLQNARFDTMQFIRAALFVISPFIITWLSIMIFGYRNRFVLIITAIWFLLTAASFTALNFRNSKIETNEVDWTKSVKFEFEKISPNLMAMRNVQNYSCQVLVANDVYPWWAFGKRAQGLDYAMCDKVNPRVNLINSLFDLSKSNDELREICIKIKSEGVDCLVATPNDLSRFQKLAKDDFLYQEKNSKWLFRIR